MPKFILLVVKSSNN